MGEIESQAATDSDGELRFLPPIRLDESSQYRKIVEVPPPPQISNLALLNDPDLIQPAFTKSALESDSDLVPSIETANFAESSVVSLENQISNLALLSDAMLFRPDLIKPESQAQHTNNRSAVVETLEESAVVQFPEEISNLALLENYFLIRPELIDAASQENPFWIPPAVDMTPEETSLVQVADDVENTVEPSAIVSVKVDEDPFAWAHEIIPVGAEAGQPVFLRPIVVETEDGLEASFVPPAVDEAFLAEEPFLFPPSVEETAKTIGEIDVELTHEVVEVESETLSAVAGEYEVQIPEKDEIVQPASYVEMPILATHKVMEAAHACTSALQSPVPGSWIFWRTQRSERAPGPVCSKLQSRFVNWRLSSTYLKGCMPEGYSLQNFIEAVPNVEYHGSTLIEGGPIDRGGSLEDAKIIEGDETRSIQQVSIDITPPEGDLPEDRAEQKFAGLPEQVQVPGTHRQWCGTSFYWNASLLNHQPLYFEDQNLERHGFSRGCIMQPVVSGVKFFGTLPALPYLMAAAPPQETSFTLGQSRPGSHACYVSQRPRLGLDAAAVESAAVVGLIFLIP